MKIFGIEFNFCKKETSLDKILLYFLSSLSEEENDYLFYNLVEKYKKHLRYEYSTDYFNNPELHPKINDFFNIFQSFTLDTDIIIGQEYIKKLTDDLQLTKDDKEYLIFEKYIIIGEEGTMSLSLQKNDLYLYYFHDDDFCINKKNIENYFFFNLNYFIITQIEFTKNEILFVNNIDYSQYLHNHIII